MGAQLYFIFSQNICRFLKYQDDVYISYFLHVVLQVSKKRLNCKHVERVACCVNIDETPCKKKCARNLECGHHCKKLCHEVCGDCKIMVRIS